MHSVFPGQRRHNFRNGEKIYLKPTRYARQFVWKGRAKFLASGGRDVTDAFMAPKRSCQPNTRYANLLFFCISGDCGLLTMAKPSGPTSWLSAIRFPNLDLLLPDQDTFATEDALKLSFIPGVHQAACKPARQTIQVPWLPSWIVTIKWVESICSKYPRQATLVVAASC